jgi:glyoxylase-like metal-dependent hydrolase (beta-lactamase superfamily II)
MMQMLKSARDSSDGATAQLARALDEWDFSDIELTPPTRLIDERLDLDLEGTPVQMLYVGPAHTSADVIAWLPVQRVVFTGDVLFRLCTPIGWDGTYDRWITALDTILALRPEIVVPGHGPICGTEGPREMREYLRYVRAESKRFFDQGLTPLEASKRIDLGPYAGWTEPERLVFNVERAYRELRGEPYDTPVDVGPMFRQVHELRQHMRARSR